MRDAPGAHEARGHDGVHALTVEVVLGAPLAGNARREDPELRDVLAPPGLGEHALEVRPLSRRACPLGLRVVHGREEPRRPPAVARRRRVDDAGDDEQAARLPAAGQPEAEVGRSGRAPHRQVRAHTGRLQG